MAEFAPFILEEEYRCHHCRRLPPDLATIEKSSSLEGKGILWPQPFQFLFATFAVIREAWGRPIPISSGYRCPKHEFDISGTALGPHVFGLALDLAVSLPEIDSLVDLILEKAPDLRIGTNRHPGSIHVHIDAAFLVSPRWSMSLIRGARWEE